MACLPTFSARSSASRRSPCGLTGASKATPALPASCASCFWMAFSHRPFSTCAPVCGGKGSMCITSGQLGLTAGQQLGMACADCCTAGAAPPTSPGCLKHQLLVAYSEAVDEGLDGFIGHITPSIGLEVGCDELLRAQRTRCSVGVAMAHAQKMQQLQQQCQHAPQRLLRHGSWLGSLSSIISLSALSARDLKPQRAAAWSGLGYCFAVSGLCLGRLGERCCKMILNEVASVAFGSSWDERVGTRFRGRSHDRALSFLLRSKTHKP